MGRYLCSKKRSKKCQASQRMINTPIAKSNFLIIMKASKISLGSHFGIQLTAVITVSGCICLHLSALFPSVTVPLHLSRWATVEMNKKIPLIGTVWSFCVLWRNSLPWEKKLHASLHKLSLAGGFLCRRSTAYPLLTESVNLLCMQQIFREPICAQTGNTRQYASNLAKHFNFHAFLSVSKGTAAVHD